jgi:hypothetical protein
MSERIMEVRFTSEADMLIFGIRQVSQVDISIISNRGVLAVTGRTEGFQPEPWPP